MKNRVKKRLWLVMLLSGFIMMTVSLLYTTDCFAGEVRKTKVSMIAGKKMSLRLNLGKSKTESQWKASSWRSSDPKTVRILKSGGSRAVLRAGHPGKAVITAKCGKKAFHCIVKVRKRSPRLSAGKLTITLKKSKKLRVVGAARITSFYSTDESAVRISKTDRKNEFLVYAVPSYGARSASVVIKADGKKLKCRVRVRASSTYNRAEGYDPAAFLSKEKIRELASYGVNKTGIVGGMRRNVAVSSDRYLKSDGTYDPKHVSVTGNDGRKIADIVYGVSFSGDRVRTANIEDRSLHLRSEDPESITDTGIRFELSPVYSLSAPEAYRIQIDPKKVTIVNLTPQLVTIREDTWNNERAACGVPSENPDNRHSAVFRVFCRNRTGMAKWITRYRGLTFTSSLRLVQKKEKDSGWQLASGNTDQAENTKGNVQRCPECGAVWVRAEEKYSTPAK